VDRPAKRQWSLEGARALLGEVRERTGTAADEVEKLLEEREGREAGSPERLAIDARIRVAVSRWVRSMEALGLEVKGLWLVDFDNGSGYYCWRWPEEELAYFHGYDEGFDGRVRIQ
jgi:hypothetical protein